MFLSLLWIRSEFAPNGAKRTIIFTRVSRSMEATFEDALHSLKGEPNVIDVRNFGLIGAVELESIEGQPTARAMQVFRNCYDNGVIIRTTGDTLAFSPPLIIEESHIEKIIDTVRTTLRAQ